MALPIHSERAGKQATQTLLSDTMKQQQKFYFGGAFYLQVLQGLYRTLSERNVALLVGESGVGKSALCDKLGQYLLRQNDPVLLLDEPPDSPEILRSILARALDLPDSVSLAVLLSDALLSRSDDFDFKSLTVILDDAHLLSDVTLLELANLSIAKVRGKPALRLLLCGESEIARRLAKHPDLSRLWQVINAGPSGQFQLEPMRPEALREFLQHFLRQSGQSERRLSGTAVQRLQKSCQGYPGQALKLASQLQQQDFIAQPDSDFSASPSEATMPPPMLQQSVTEGARKHSQSWLARTEHRQARTLLPVAAVVVLASLGFLYQQLAESEEQVALASPHDEVSQQVADAALDNDSLQANFSSGTAADQTASPFVNPVEVDEQLPIAVAADDEESGPDLAPVISEEQLNREALLAAIERARVAAQEQLASDQAVSDSGLVLVTAAERGISENSFALPEIETLLVTEPEQPLSQPAIELAGEERTTGAATQLSTVVVSGSAATGNPTPVAVDAPQSEADPGEIWRNRVAGWVAAWQAQDLDAYFSFYHDRFMPRYQNSLSAWRSNRERVIGSASDIELEMYDFDVVSESSSEVEVHFWLDYRSPSYQDQTRKKLVLAPFEEAWLIIEEVNLEVRV